MIRHKFKSNNHKYNAKKTMVDGINFPSLLEARYYSKLKMIQQTGEILFFIRQPRFDLPGSTSYSADFLEFWSDGTVVVSDCKGVETKEFIKSKKQVEFLYPIEINVVRKV